MKVNQNALKYYFNSVIHEMNLEKIKSINDLKDFKLLNQMLKFKVDKIYDHIKDFE